LADSTYRAFVSYSHESDQRLANSLQSSLSRFAKPWYRLRSMRIFQDEASLSANPALWNAIETALGQCEYFVLLASRASAKSRWVHQEVQWWLQNRSVEKLLLCLTEGDIVWDDQRTDFDWDKTSAIPSSLKGAFSAEPLYADFRAAKSSGKFAESDPPYRAALLDVAAPLMGRPKDELDSEDIRLHRKARRTAVAAASFVVILGFIAAVALKVARDRQLIAVSRALASAAASPQDDRSLSMLLSLEARLKADTVESRRSLLASIQRVPNAEAFLWGHTDAATSAVFSPDGRTVLSAGWDDRLLIWSTATHQLLGQPIEAPKGLVGVAFSPDGARFAAAAKGTIVIWDTVSRQRVHELHNTDEEFEHVAFSPTGHLLAASTAAFGAHPSHVFLWDTASGTQVGEPILGSNFAFSADEGLLAIGRYEDLILFDLRSHREIPQPLTGHTKNIAAVSFSSDGTTVAASSEDKSIVLWDVKTHTVIGTLTGQPDTVTSLYFDPHGEDLYTGSLDGTIIRWDLDKLEAADTPVKSFGASIASIFRTPDDHLKSLALDKERVIILDVNDDPPLGRGIKATDSHESNIAFSPDGRYLASGSEFGGITVWEVSSGQPSGMPLPGHERQVSSLAFAPDGKTLISGGMDQKVMFWDVATRAELGPPTSALGSPVWSLASSPDGTTVAAGGDAQLVLWDLNTRKQRGPPSTAQKDRIWSLAFSPNGQTLASAGNNLQTLLWKTDQQDRPVKTFGVPAARADFELMPVAVSFDSGGTLLATSSPGHSVTLWKVSSGQPILPVLYGHTQAVSGVAFSGDDKLLASASADGTIRLWDVPTHELVGTLSTGEQAIRSIAFQPRGGVLASVDESDSIIFWTVSYEQWIRRACQIANRNMTLKEWSTYVGNRPYRKTCPDL
jgi:WD40 repeat protein